MSISDCALQRMDGGLGERSEDLEVLRTEPPDRCMCIQLAAFPDHVKLLLSLFNKDEPQHPTHRDCFQSHSICILVGINLMSQRYSKLCTLFRAFWSV